MSLSYLRNNNHSKSVMRTGLTVGLVCCLLSSTSSLTYGSSPNRELQRNELRDGRRLGNERRIFRGGCKRDREEVLPGDLDLGHGATGVSWVPLGLSIGDGVSPALGLWCRPWFRILSVHLPHSKTFLLLMWLPVFRSNRKLEAVFSTRGKGKEQRKRKREGRRN